MSNGTDLGSGNGTDLGGTDLGSGDNRNGTDLGNGDSGNGSERNTAVVACLVLAIVCTLLSA